VRLLIIHKDFTAEAELNDSKTAKAIYDALSIDGDAQIWKEEVYFEIPVNLPYENPTEKVETGDLCYWPPGKAFCIFFGKTQPISAVNVVGKVKTGLEKFRDVKDGDDIVLEKG